MSFPPSTGVKILTSLGLHPHPIASILLPTVPCYAGPAIIVNFLIDQGVRIRRSLAGNGADDEGEKIGMVREKRRSRMVVRSLGNTFPLFASSMIFALLTNLRATTINLSALIYTLSRAGYYFTRTCSHSHSHSHTHSDADGRRTVWELFHTAFWVLGCGSCLRLLWVGGRRI